MVRYSEPTNLIWMCFPDLELGFEFSTDSVDSNHSSTRMEYVHVVILHVDDTLIVVDVEYPEAVTVMVLEDHPGIQFRH